jgi:general secretion pathway protein B
MSFILDALKKSESDRQRQSGPALFEVKVAPPRSRLPLWALAIGVLLAVNLAIVAWMMLRRPPAHADSALAASAAPAAQALSPAAAAPSVASSNAPPPAVVSAPPAVAGAPAAPTVNAVPASATLTGATAPPVAAAPNSGNEGESPQDLAPATDAPLALNSHVRRGTADGVPLYQDWAAMPGTHVPPLRLDLHVYAARPEERFVMINMKKLHEGDSLPEGVRLESITPEGAVLSYNGSRFLLPRD